MIKVLLIPFHLLTAEQYEQEGVNAHGLSCWKKKGAPVIGQTE